MKIELQGQQIRVSNYGDRTFVDVREVEKYTHYSHQINFYPDYHYCALIKRKGESALSLIIFENEKWFNEWESDKDENIEVVTIFSNQSKKEKPNE